MRLEDIDFKNLSRVATKKKPQIYYDNKFYYKVWDNWHHTAYHTIVGLDTIYHSMNNLSTVRLGLITDETCSAFQDLIFNSTNICCGYVMHKGTETTNHNEYLKLLDKLVINAFSTGYSLRDVNIHNTVMYNNQCSVIDIDTNPIKLFHNKKLNELELKRWYDSFYNLDNLYLDKIKQRLNVVIQEISQ